MCQKYQCCVNDLLYMCEYWLFLFYIHWSIGCSGWRFLTETCHYRNTLFGTFLPSPMRGTNSWQWYTTTH